MAEAERLSRNESTAKLAAIEKEAAAKRRAILQEGQVSQDAEFKRLVAAELSSISAMPRVHEQSAGASSQKVG